MSSASDSEYSSVGSDLLDCILRYRDIDVERKNKPSWLMGGTEMEVKANNEILQLDWRGFGSFR